MCCGVSLLLLLPLACGQVADLRTYMFTHYGNPMLPWKDAQAYCREHHTDLVTIASPAENQKFLITQGWIGLSRAGPSSSWEWSSGDQVADFFSWGPGKKRTNCVQLSLG